MLLACCLIRRRRARRSYLSKDFRKKISGPVLDSLRVNGDSPTMQHIIKTRDSESSRQQMYQSGMQDYAEVVSQVSTPSSPSLDSLVTPALPPGFLVDSSRYGSSSFTATEEGRRSWVTVEGTATARRSESSLESHRSDTTFPESTHHLIPPPSFLAESGTSSFRSGLDLTIPSLEDLPSMQSEGAWRRAQLRPSGVSSEFYSTSHGSSLAFSSAHQSSPRLLTGTYAVRDSNATPGIRTLERSRTPSLGDEQLAATGDEIRRPGAVRLSSQQWLHRNSSRPWIETSLKGSTNSVADPSFGSEENWRVFSPGGPPRPQTRSVSYRELVDEAPFNPSRPGTADSPSREGAQPGERSSAELTMPGKWYDGQTSARASSTALGQSASGYSHVSSEMVRKSESKGSQLGQGASANWGRDESGKVSDGSFKAFL